MRIAIVCPIEPQLIGGAGLLQGVLTHLSASSADVELVVPAGAAPKVLGHVKTVRANKFVQQAKRYDGIFYHIAPEAGAHDWICVLAKQTPGVVVLLEGAGHRFLFDQEMMSGSKAVLTFSHAVRRNVWKELPQLDVRVVERRAEVSHAELYLQVADGTEAMRRWLRRQVSQAFAREVVTFGVVPDVTDAVLRRFAKGMSDFL